MELEEIHNLIKNWGQIRAPYEYYKVILTKTKRESLTIVAPSGEKFRLTNSDKYDFLRTIREYLEEHGFYETVKYHIPRTRCICYGDVYYKEMDNLQIFPLLRMPQSLNSRTFRRLMRFLGAELSY